MTVNHSLPRPAINPWHAEFKAMLLLAAPLAFANLAQIAINTTDIIMMGWLGPQQLAAGALAANLLFPLHYFSIGVITAVAPIIAQALGARAFRQVRRAVRQGIWVAITISLPVMAVLWHGREILLLMGQTEASSDLAQVYLRIALWAFLPGLCFAVLRCFVAGHSRPRSAVVITVAAIGVNAISNWLLMFGNLGLPRLELAGAAISTVLVNALMFIGLLAFVVRDRRFKRYRILVRFWRPDWTLFRDILRLGLPIGLTVLAEAGMFAVSTFLMGLIGTLQVAAHAIAIQCAGIVFMLPLGVSQAATIRVGYAAGAGNVDGARRAGWSALVVGFVGAAATALLLWIGDGPIRFLFLGGGGADAPVLAALVAQFVGFAAFFQLFDATQAIAAGALRGLKDTRTPMIIATAGYWGVGTGGAVLLAFLLDWGGAGIWIGLLLGLAAVAGMLTVRFHWLSRQHLG